MHKFFSLSLQTTAEEFAGYFSHFDQVVEAKVIYDKKQIPKE